MPRPSPLAMPNDGQYKALPEGWPPAPASSVASNRVLCNPLSTGQFPQMDGSPKRPQRVRSEPNRPSNSSVAMPRRSKSENTAGALPLDHTVWEQDVAELDRMMQRIAARSGCPELIAVVRQHSGTRIGNTRNIRKN